MIVLLLFECITNTMPVPGFQHKKPSPEKHADNVGTVIVIGIVLLVEPEFVSVELFDFPFILSMKKLGESYLQFSVINNNI